MNKLIKAGVLAICAASISVPTFAFDSGNHHVKFQTQHAKQKQKHTVSKLAQHTTKTKKTLTKKQQEVVSKLGQHKTKQKKPVLNKKQKEIIGKLGQHKAPGCKPSTQHSVPEMDAANMALGLGLMGGVVALMRERRKTRRA